jgi:hypothetical protein
MIIMHQRSPIASRVLATGHSPSVSDFCFAIRHLLLSLGELHCRQNKRKRN